MSAGTRTWLRRGAGAAVLVIVLLRLGIGPVRHGLASISAGSLVAALGLGGVVALGSGWRWLLVSRRLGLELPLGAAVAACYRSQLLNSVLPGGVLGDVHRGLRHGRETGDRSRSLRAVAWERGLGQLFSILITVGVLTATDSGAPDALRWAPVVIVPISLLAWRYAPVRVRQALAADGRRLRPGLPMIAVASTLTLAGTTALFLLAARAVGVSAPAGHLLPVALVVLLVVALPLNVGGWGPREGAAAWAFAAQGMAGTQGLSTSVAFGVLGLAATLPGMAVLLATRRPAPVVVGRG